MDKIFYPESIVIVGVSENPNNLARVITENIIRFQYTGKLYLLERNSGHINGFPICDSLNDLPEDIDLACSFFSLV